jgi:hypothetical protein
VGLPITYPNKINNVEKRKEREREREREMRVVGNKFHSVRPKEKTVGLSENPIPRDRHLEAIPEKSSISYPNRSGLGLYSKLN